MWITGASLSLCARHARLFICFLGSASSRSLAALLLFVVVSWLVLFAFFLTTLCALTILVVFLPWFNVDVLPGIDQQKARLE